MSYSSGSPITTVELPDAALRHLSPETNRCLLCGGALQITETELLDTRFGSSGTYSILRCVTCGLEQTCPRPSLAELKKLYERYYNFGGEKGTRYTRWREQFLS